MKQFEDIVKLLDGGKLLTTAMFKEFAEEEFAEALWWSAAVGRSNLEDLVDDALSRKSGDERNQIQKNFVKFERLTTQCVKAACKGVTDWSYGSTEEVLKETVKDFNWIATAAMLTLESPYLNWIWLCYRAEHLPYAAVPVEGSFSELVNVSRREAMRRLEAAQRSEEKTRDELILSAAEQAKAAARKLDAETEAQELVGQLLSQKRASADIVEKIAALLMPEATVTTSPRPRKAYPQSWFQLLEAQQNQNATPWDAMWSGSENWFPALCNFVMTKCFGVVLIVKGAKAPALGYLFVLKSGAPLMYIGKPPAKIPSERKQRTPAFPDNFVRFFNCVHNGFYGDYESGLMPLGVRTLDKYISEKDAFGDLEDKPFELSDLLPILSYGNGNYICINVRTSSKRRITGGCYWHETPEESVFDESVTKLIDGRFLQIAAEFRDR